MIVTDLLALLSVTTMSLSFHLMMPVAEEPLYIGDRRAKLAYWSVTREIWHYTPSEQASTAAL